MNPRTFYIKDIGEVDFVKHKRAKHLKITVKSSGKIRVTLPLRCSYDQAEKFIYQQRDKIKNCLEKIKSNTKIFDENSDFRTKNYRLKISAHSGNNCVYRINQDLFEFYYPQNTAIDDLQTQNTIKTALIELMRKDAKDYLPARLNEIANKFSFNYKKVYVKNLKTRWGSCSAVNNINLNLHLMRLPDHLIDYVILHELAHTREKNHGKGFRSLLDKHVMDSKRLDRELKSYSIDL